MTTIVNGTTGITFSDNSIQNTAAIGFRNRIINGGMVIDQRNAGASITANDDTFPLDRWKFAMSQSSKGTSQQSTVAPSGFINSLLFTSSSAYSVLASDSFIIRQLVEGLNITDLGWGAAGAQTVTLSFWVRSSLTGSFGVVISNSAQNRCYPVLYTISAANTWEQKSITIPGDTTGTWLTTNGVGMRVNFGLGVGSTFSGTSGAWSSSTFTGVTGATSVVGTNGATFYITGVQLEKSTTASSFDFRSYGTELMLCQRYYYRIKASAANSIFGSGYNVATTDARHFVPFPVSMRTAPTAIEQSGTAGDYRITHFGGNTACNAVPVFNSADTFSAFVSDSVASGLTSGQGSVLGSVNSSAYLAWSAEL